MIDESTLIHEADLTWSQAQPGTEIGDPGGHDLADSR